MPNNLSAELRDACQAIKASTSAAMTVCARFSRGLSGRSTRLFYRKNRGKSPEQNVPHCTQKPATRMTCSFPDDRKKSDVADA